MNLPEFLLARIAEDERAAQAPNIGPIWRYVDAEMHVEVGSDSLYWAPSAAEHAATCDYEDHSECSDARMNALLEGEHIVRWQPRRVLAECEAKRQIVELAVEAGLDTGPALMAPREYERASTLGETLRRLALPYADHSDYRDEWRP